MADGQNGPRTALDPRHTTITENHLFSKKSFMRLERTTRGEKD
jgi:hypothetical protein